MSVLSTTHSVLVVTCVNKDLADRLWRALRIWFYFGIKGFARNERKRRAWVEALTEDTMRVSGYRPLSFPIKSDPPRVQLYGLA